MENKTDNLGKRLRKVRIDNGLSQIDLAKILGYKKAEVISRFETNKRIPNTEAIIRLSTKLKVDLHWLLTGTRNLGNALELLTDKEYLNEYYSIIAEKYKIIRRVVGTLESKQQNGQTLTDDEVELLLTSKK